MRQWYLLWGNTSRWFIIFFWSTADLLIWGLLTKYLNTVGGDNFNFLTVLIGGVIFMHFIGRSQGGISIAQLEDVWTRNLINFFATPLKLTEYMIGLSMTAILTTFVSFVSMITLAFLLFHYSLFQFGFLLIPYILILFIFGIALGLIGISVIIRYGPSAETVAWIIPTALSPFSGVFYPVATLPKAFQVIAHLIPSSYVFEGMRSVVLTGNFSLYNLLIGLILSIVYVFIGYGLLRYYFNQSLKRGLFIRFLTDAW